MLLVLTLMLADPTPTVDQLVERVVAARKEKAAAVEKEAAAVKALREAVGALTAKLKELGIEPEKPEVPDPPRPVDAFVAALRAAYAADTSPADPAKKREALADLIEVYKQAVPLAGTADLGTAGAVIAKVKAAAVGLGLTVTDLAEVRKAVGKELLAAFPADVPLDAVGRVKLAAVFSRIHSALSQVSP